METIVIALQHYYYRTIPALSYYADAALRTLGGHATTYARLGSRTLDIEGWSPYNCNSRGSHQFMLERRLEVGPKQRRH